ncbi:MAG: patatin-like phospholipase family protein [Anaerolineae bacterium]
MTSAVSPIPAQPQAPPRRRLGLALGGGGVRGMAHVGVLRVLEAEQIPIDCIAGSSVGSLVGAAYAAGIGSERLSQLALEIRWRDLAQLQWSRAGLVSFEKLETTLVNAIGTPTFAQLEIPFAAVAADLATAEAVVINAGPVARAVRASCSVPGFVPPVEADGRLLIDGGVVNNLPIAITRQLGADVVVAVTLGAPPGTHPRGLLGIGITAIEFLILKSGDDPAAADVHLQVPTWGLGSVVRTSERHELLALGEQAARDALPAIRALLA